MTGGGKGLKGVEDLNLKIKFGKQSMVDHFLADLFSNTIGPSKLGLKDLSLDKSLIL